MKVSDLTEAELKSLIGEVVEDKLRNLLDPDYGLELRGDFIEKVKASVDSAERIPFKDIKKKLGLS